MARGYTRQQVVAEYQRPAGPLGSGTILRWFCFGIAEDQQRVEFRVGFCGSSDEGSSFLSCEDDRPVDCPVQTVYRGDRETAWSVVTVCLR